MDIFFFEAFEEEQEALKKYNADKFTAGYSWKTIQEYGADEPPAPVISVRTQSRIPTAWAGKIKALLSRSTGFDHLTAYREETGAKDLKYGFLPLYCNRSVAEQALTLWMALLRKLPLQTSQFKTFNRDGITGHETCGRNLLVVGVGNIGSEVVKIGQGLDMNVKAVDPEQKYDFVEYTSYEEAAPKADIIVAAMDLNPTSEGYFSYEKLKQARPGAVFVNIARGELSPLSGMLKLINEGHLSALGMDVYENEKLIGPAMRGEIEADTPELQALKELSKMPNVIFTPHNAFNTAESVDRKSEQSIQQLEEFKQKGNFLWNIP
ncbi:NAD(P)-dependent oxidoreductase [Lentisphaerota bacterium ZTH]|nr:hydroxyacid dehydrogenase [Lentisphaerota bacterium]WET06553.1 NAD(P)-dependent oxidoreductase [Lentisphaerota bacterium ZTH]